MKKVSLIIFVVVILSLLTVAAVATGNAMGASKADATELYSNMLSQQDDMTPEQKQSAIHNILAKIASGDKSKAKEYAEIIRAIIGNIYTFEDSDVFTVANELLTVMDIQAAGGKGFGIQNILLSQNDDKSSICIEHICCEKYSVEKVDEPTSEIIYIGEKAQTYDGSLGSTLIKVTFYDTDMSDGFAAKYSAYTPYTLNPSYANTIDEVKFMVCHNASHSTVIYIGSDGMLEATEQPQAFTGSICGTIDLLITCK